MAAVVVVGYNWATREPSEVDPVAISLKQLRSSDPKVRVVGAESLATLGPRAGAAVPTLLNVLREDSSPNVRLAVAQALVNCGVSADMVSPEVTRLMQFESDPGVRNMLKPLTTSKP